MEKLLGAASVADVKYGNARNRFALPDCIIYAHGSVIVENGSEPVALDKNLQNPMVLRSCEVFVGNCGTLFE